MAVAQFVGVPVPQIMENLVDGVQAASQELLLNCLGEQIGAVPVPQTKEDVECEGRDSSDAAYRQDCRSACCVATTGPSTGDQTGDRACRDSADAVHRQGRRYVYCEAATGPLTVAQPGNQECRASADAVHRQGCRRACGDAATDYSFVAQPGDQARRDSAEAVHRQCCRRACCDTATGPSDTDGFEDCESPAGAVHRRSSGRVKNVPLERISEGIGEQIVDAPVSHSQPEILKEVVEVVKAVKNAPQERISGKIGEQFDDDIIPVDQPGDQARRDPQACGVAATGPSASNCGEDVGSPARAVHRQNSGRACDVAATGPSNPDSDGDGGSLARAVRQQSRESTCDHADQPGDQARRNLTDSAQEQGASGANGRAVPANGLRRPNMQPCARLKPCSGYGHRC